MPDFQSVQDCFVHDDGSLPGIEVRLEDSREVPRIYEFLMSCSKTTTPEATFWDEVAQREVLINSVPNAAFGVVDGTTSGFRTCVEMQVAGVHLPEIGIFIFRDSIELDWRMGPEWTHEKVLAFFELLHLLKGQAPTLELADPEVEGIPNPEAFFRFWNAYEAARQVGEIGSAIRS